MPFDKPYGAKPRETLAYWIDLDHKRDPGMTAAEFKAALRELHVKGKEFAARLNMDPTTVSRWAVGTKPVPPWIPLVLDQAREIERLRRALAALSAVIPTAAE